MKRYLVIGLAATAAAAVAAGVPAKFILAPLLGVLILRVGLATFGSLRAGAAHIPSGPPTPVGPEERVTYRCAGCGAEMLLLVRGTEVPPRHCGERMVERIEVARPAPG